MFEAVVAFFAMAVLDIVFALYTRRVVDGAAGKAALWATCIMLLNATVILSYVKNPAMIIYAALGAFAGTYLVVRLDHKKPSSRLTGDEECKTTHS